MLFYPLAVGVAFSAYYSSNTLIFKALGERSLGVYSALVGIALFLRSFTSGFISTRFGFITDFEIVCILLFISVTIFKILEEG
ncbi:hypothetical protein [Acidianus sp. HS-5]|uniref:hypothetical protein n=1 Tax=Acidianus sp. HS-5 TaxID=2886040 RepID=UPI001F15B30A|nr:hypothetical protein [Acidianus sp. HS-5]BDC18438.1 hypothetical protein HS5_13280 [Acidianus sp. HS-5]